MRRPRASDLVYGSLVLALTFLAARVWWLSAITPGQDYPQFLVFVRVARDFADPSSPFHGTYDVGSWFMPTMLPIELTRAIAWACGGSIETAGKVLLTLQNVGLVAASAYLLRVLGRPRWAIVLLFPILHSRWTVIGGFVVYATAFPWIVLGWALTVRWFARLDRTSGLLLGTCLCSTLLWHGLGFAMLGLGFATLWVMWRAGSTRERLVSVLPTLPSLALMALWMGSTFRGKPGGAPLRWRPIWEALDRLLDHVYATVPHAAARMLVLSIILFAGLVVCRRNIGASGAAARMWRVENPFLVLAAVYLAGYFAFPADGLGVEVLSPRFSIQAAMASVFAWNLPERVLPRSCVVAVVASFSAWCLQDIADRFRTFDDDTRGASALMDEVGPYETLYHWPAQSGNSDAFNVPNRAMIELEQFSTARHGGLPNSSFAGYGYNPVRYVNGNPMPFLRGAPSYGPGMTRFDYVLTRVGQGPNDPRFRLRDEKSGWQLYAVCGSKRFPTCDTGAKP